MKMPTVKCLECGAEVDARRHNLRAHRRTHNANGSNPIKMADLFELQPATPETPRESPVALERETFQLRGS